jgi:hypothetical protein
MSLTASDGLTYKDVAHRLLGEPEKTPRNNEIEKLRYSGYSEAEVKVWYTAYDRARGGHIDRYSRGWAAVSRVRARQSDSQPQVSPPLRPAGKHSLQGWLGPRGYLPPPREVQ